MRKNLSATLGMWLFIVTQLSQVSPAFALEASWYSRESLIREGTWARGEQLMANGHRFDERQLTCATRLYPLGSKLQVTNKDNHKSVIVTTTDRIGRRFATKRIDLSPSAFSRIANLQQGIVPVQVKELKWKKSKRWIS